MLFWLRICCLLGLVVHIEAMECEKQIHLPKVLIRYLATFMDDKTASSWFALDKNHQKVGENYYATKGKEVWKELFPDIPQQENWDGYSMLCKYRNCIKLLRDKIEIEFFKRKGNDREAVFWSGIINELPTSVDFKTRLMPLELFNLMENVPLKHFLLDELPIEICIRTWFALDSVSKYILRGGLTEEEILPLVPTFKENTCCWRRESELERYCIRRRQFFEHHLTFLKNNKEMFFKIFFSKRDQKKRRFTSKKKYLYYLRVGYYVICGGLHKK